MSQMTGPTADSPHHHGRIQIRDRLRRAIQEMKSTPRNPVEPRIRWY